MHGSHKAFLVIKIKQHLAFAKHFSTKQAKKDLKVARCFLVIKIKKRLAATKRFSTI